MTQHKSWMEAAETAVASGGAVSRDQQGQAKARNLTAPTRSRGDGTVPAPAEAPARIPAFGAPAGDRPKHGGANLGAWKTGGADGTAGDDRGERR
jgi:hypothetical protein